MICLYYWTLLTRPEFVEVVRKVREAAGVIIVNALGQVSAY